MTRVDELKALLVRVEVAHGPDRAIDADLYRVLNDINATASVGWDAVPTYSGSIDVARALLQERLSGWLYRLCECHLTDDAYVCPDFNHPVHGAQFQRWWNDAFDGRDPMEVFIEATDVAREPAGQPALALVQSILLALVFLEEMSK